MKLFALRHYIKLPPTPRIVAKEKVDPIYWSAHFAFGGKYPGDAEA
jgi:hypothetical protein